MNQEQAVAILSALKPLAKKLSRTNQVIYTVLNQVEQTLLVNFTRLIEAATEAGLDKNEWENLCMAAGLSHSDQCLLENAMIQQIVQADPIGVQVEIEAFFSQKRRASRWN